MRPYFAKIFVDALKPCPLTDLLWRESTCKVINWIAFDPTSEKSEPTSFLEMEYEATTNFDAIELLQSICSAFCVNESSRIQ